MKITNNGSLDQAFKTRDGLEIVKAGKSKTINDKHLMELEDHEKKHYEALGISFSKTTKTRAKPGTNTGGKGTNPNPDPDANSTPDPNANSNPDPNANPNPDPDSK